MSGYVVVRRKDPQWAWAWFALTRLDKIECTGDELRIVAATEEQTEAPTRCAKCPYADGCLFVSERVSLHRHDGEAEKTHA